MHSMAPGREILVLVLIFIVSFSLRMAFLHEPFERDEGVYAYIGQEILRGGVPYKDVLDIKPPGVYYIYATAIALGGETVEGIRIVTAVYSLLTVILVFLTARKLAGQWSGLAAALLYGVYSTSPHIHGSGCNTEVFMVLPEIAAIYFFLRRNDLHGRRYLLLSGLCLSAAMLIKTVSVAYVLLFFIMVIIPEAGSLKVRNVVRDLVILALPMILTAALVIFYFYAHDALHDFWYWNVIHPRKYLNSSDVKGPNWFILIPYLLPELLPLFVIGVPVLIWRIATNRTHGDILVLLSIVAACVGVYLPGKLFPHYFIQLIPPVSIAAGISFGEVAREKGRSSLAALLLMTVLLLYPIMKYYKYYFIYSADEVSTRKFGPTFVRSQETARYVKERTSPNDYFYQWGMATELYFLSGRRAPNRYISNMMIKWSQDPHRAVKLMIDSIAMKRPRYIYVDSAWANTTGYEELLGELKKDYLLDATFPDGIMYRLSPGSELSSTRMQPL
jgi:4-amino-4-deoxy-L-arabinose transferase-like glycosyltransferase